MSDKTESTCKVGTGIQKWGLDSLDDALLEQRKAGTSLRNLESYYNQQVLEAAMREAGIDPLDGEVENIYRLYTDDDVSAGTKVDVRSRLERNGVDPKSVEDDFVSYQTIRTHLNQCLGVKTARKTRIERSEAKNTVFKLLSRTEAITGRTIERLSNAGELTIGDPDVTLSLRVGCSECGEEYTFARLVDRGRCSCQER
ncbi:rod-determining factor RdfA [Haloprofundus salinisoli]|uniref:rod-determining factor RdfA n=1 Tax=Haloprofundus salinisoli TaxID=2876193 RepID=UPI001CCC3CCD|nr:rod-determining factor RdfA [Haloprofundus salinisoli]